MKMSKISTCALAFPLIPVDDWPPISTEHIPCIKVGDNYQINSAPLFVKNLSVRDVISVTFDKTNQVNSWSHIHNSDNSTVWFLIKNHLFEIDTLLSNLRLLGCNTVIQRQFGVVSVDVPGELPIIAVDEILNKVDDNDIAIAYPSFRHTE